MFGVHVFSLEFPLATRLFADSPHGASGNSNQLGGSSRSGNQAQNQSPMAARRQAAWEAQLKDNAFLKATTKPIVDDTVTFKPPIPHALREVKRSMDKASTSGATRTEQVDLPEMRI